MIGTRKTRIVVWGLAVLGLSLTVSGCSSLSSAYSRPVSRQVNLNGAVIAIYPFLATDEAFDDEWTASFDTTFSFANEIQRRGTAKVFVADDIFATLESQDPSEVDAAADSEIDAESAEDSDERAAAAKEDLIAARMLTEDDLLAFAAQSEAEYFVLGLVDQYNYFEVEYSVFVHRRDEMRMVAQAGGVRRIPWYNLNREKHLGRLSARIVTRLGL